MIIIRKRFVRLGQEFVVVALVDEHGRGPRRNIRVLPGTLAAQFTVHLNASFPITIRLSVQCCCDFSSARNMHFLQTGLLIKLIQHTHHFVFLIKYVIPRGSIGFVYKPICNIILMNTNGACDISR